MPGTLPGADPRRSTEVARPRPVPDHLGTTVTSEAEPNAPPKAGAPEAAGPPVPPRPIRPTCTFTVLPTVTSVAVAAASLWYVVVPLRPIWTVWPTGQLEADVVRRDLDHLAADGDPATTQAKAAVASLAAVATGAA